MLTQHRSNDKNKLETIEQRINVLYCTSAAAQSVWIHQSGFASEAVGQLFGESERLGFIEGTKQIPCSPHAPLLQHQPAGALSSHLLRRPLLRPLPLQPPEDGEGREPI